MKVCINIRNIEELKELENLLPWIPLRSKRTKLFPSYAYPGSLDIDLTNKSICWGDNYDKPIAISTFRKRLKEGMYNEKV